MAGIAVYHFDQLRGTAPAGLEDVWPRVRAILAEQSRFNTNEEAIRSQQHRMIRDRGFRVASPFGNWDEVCSSSWFLRHRFYYHFRGAEEFFWITALLDRAYAPAAIYFPRRRAMISVCLPLVSAETLEEFEAMRAGLTKAQRGSPVVATGISHPFHVLWNELPALDHTAHTDLPARMQVAAMFEPFGSIAALFPELARGSRFLRFDEVSNLNRDHPLLVPLGAWTITESLQSRVHRFAARQVAPAVVTAREKFRQKWRPIFWFSVKPPVRTCLDQAASLAFLIEGIRREYPGSGFILNGTSFPWDMKTNPNYVPGFAKQLETDTQADSVIISDILERLGADVRQAVQVLSGVSFHEELVWGEVVDFFFCHGGTMAPKIGWTHRVPGMIHTSTNLRRYLQTLPPQVENGPPCFFLSDHLTKDSPPQRYIFFDLEREDQDYAFTDLNGVLAELLAAFRSVAGSRLRAPRFAARTALAG